MVESVLNKHNSSATRFSGWPFSAQSLLPEEGIGAPFTDKKYKCIVYIFLPLCYNTFIQNEGDAYGSNHSKIS